MGIFSCHVSGIKRVKEINAAKFFTIISDEVPTFNKEELALVRFVDKNEDIQ